MDYLGSDFNNSGSVMAKAELTAARLKRGECLTCGRKCYRKKLFKMVPLNQVGKVLNGRCLNCKPLQAKDVSLMSSRSHHISSMSSNSHHSGGRLPTSISSGNISNSSRSGRRLGARSNKNSSHLRDDHYGQHQHSSPRNDIWKSIGENGSATTEEKEASPRENSKVSSPRRSFSISSPTRSYRTNASIGLNTLNSIHSGTSRNTFDTALSTRPSIASSSPTAARKITESPSTYSTGGTSALAAAASNARGNSISRTSDRSISVTDCFGSFRGERSPVKSTEIVWTPSPQRSECRRDEDDLDSHRSNDDEIRSPSRLDSLKPAKSTARKQYPTVRDDLEQDASALMTKEQQRLPHVGGTLCEDIYDELAVSDQSDHASGTDSPRKKHRSNDIDSTVASDGIDNETRNEANSDEDDDMNSKIESEASFNSSLIASIPPSEAKIKGSFSKTTEFPDLKIERNSVITESDVSLPKTVSVNEEDDQMVSMCSHQHAQNRRTQAVLNRGGEFHSRFSHGHGRPNLGTHVLTGSTRTLSSMSSIGEEDHLLTHSSHRRQNLARMGSFSRYRQASFRTIGSLSTIEGINEEDTGIQTSIDDLSTDSLQGYDLSVSTPTPPLRLGAKVPHAADEAKEVYCDSQDENRSLNIPVRSNDTAIQKSFISSNQDDKPSSIGNGLCTLFEEELAFLRESSESPALTRKAFQRLSECEACCNGDHERYSLRADIVVTCMQSYAFAYDVQLWGCRAILNMSSSSARVGNDLARSGAVDVIIQAMKQFLEEGEDLQEQAIIVLSNLAITPSNITYLVGKDDDAIDAIIKAMGQCSGNPKIQVKGCEALTNLASHNDTNLRLKIMEKGAGEAILFNAVTMHSEDSNVQQYAFSAVRNLCNGCEENQIKFLELGVVDLILIAMKKHRMVAGLQEAGAGAISILAGNNVETKMVIEENGGIELILRAILDHASVASETECYIRTLLTLSLDSYNSNHLESRTSEANVKAADAVDSVISAIDTTIKDSNPPKLSLAIEAVINAMETHEDVSAVQEVGCTILSGLSDLVEEGIATDANETKKEIVDAGALDAINMAMVVHKYKARVQERACVVLWSLAIEDNFNAIIDAKCEHLLQDAAKNFPEQCKELVDNLIQRTLYEHEEELEV